MSTEKMIVTLTVAELQEMLDVTIESKLLHLKPSQAETTNKGETIRGIKALSHYIGCGIAKAQELKNKGLIPYSQYGNRILFNSIDVDKSLKVKRDEK